MQTPQRGTNDADDRLLPPETARQIDHELRSRLAGLTQGLSPVDIASAVVDWAGHLALSPGKLLSLAESAARRAGRMARPGSDPADAKLADRRMQGEAWRKWPWSVFARGHAEAREWVAELTSGIDGVSRDHEQMVAFLAQQFVELLSPANNPLTNPEVIAATSGEQGRNLARGARHLATDLERKRRGEPLPGRERFEVGRDIAITPGKVVFKNRLIELIQYEPQTKEVMAEPVLIVPAWIMKYYILDLSPGNSLVRYLVGQGKTVFAISWKNPGAEERDLGMHDYLDLGVFAAMDAIGRIVPGMKLHAVGYCLGGTLLSIAAACMARDGDERLASMSLFAAQIDFREAGEIQLFLGEGTFTLLEAMMRRKGYLDVDSMVGAFSALRVSDLVHEPAVQRYLLGKDRSLNDLMAWNEDGTRMPYRMHTEYLKNCYLENNLAECRYEVGGRPVCVGDIRVPAFVLGTVTDHVAPWQSVYKVHRLMQNEITFVLTTGGHNAGIACGPEHPRRKYQLGKRSPGELYRDPARFAAETPVTDGSWWPAWNAWLDAQSEGLTAPPAMGAPEAGLAPLADAPGEYVHG